MAVTLPKINITFKQLATSFIQRSERGVAVLIVRDTTAGGNGYATYTDITELENAPYTAANKQYITDCMTFGPLRCGVAKVGTDGTLADALALVTAHEKTGWITVAGGTSARLDGSGELDQGMGEGSQELEGSGFQGGGAGLHARGQPVQRQGDLYGQPGRGDRREVHPVAGGSAGCLQREPGRHQLPVRQPQGGDGAGGPGRRRGQRAVLLVNDDLEVHVGVDVNSLTTTNGSTLTEDMKYIETVEAMDMMRDDITKAFRDEYLGNYRNSLNNQMLLISAINYYFLQLAQQDILDPEHANRASIDVATQRSAWVGSGKAEAESWDDATVRSNPFKRNVYLSGDVKILGSMVNLEFVVTLQ